MRDPFPIDHIGPALRELHAAATALQSCHPVRLTGDAQYIFNDVCSLIELLGKIDFIADDAKLTAARLELAFIANRPALRAAE